MYLKGSKLSMNRRRRRPNPVLIIFLLASIGLLIYVNVWVVPKINPPFVPTPTPTRDPVWYATEAADLFGQGKFNSAIETYQEAINAHPGDIDNYLKIARLLIYTNQYERARVQSENAILLNNKVADAYALLGWSQGFMKNYKDGEIAARKAVELDPNNGFAHAALAYILALRVEAKVDDLNTMDLAIAESRTAIALNPGLVEAHWSRGYVLEVTSNYADAIAEYEKAIKLNPNIATLHQALGRNLFTQNELSRAILEFTKAYSLNPTNGEPNFYISRVWANQGEWAKAIQYATQALKDNPGNAVYHAQLGSMIYRSGQLRGSIPSFELAVMGGTTPEGVVVEPIKLEMGTSSVNIYSQYGIALAKLNRCDEAVSIATTMQQTIPDDETGIFNAGEMIRICQENLKNPPTSEPSPTPTPITAPTATPGSTPLPQLPTTTP
ncbi:MAG: tetratricopeptide repeat protein [Anaerolineaceae bacterium]|nr:tetratricopeptide repeat protein [Anaerolineaceae bacterium]